MAQIKVLVVDDSALARELIRAILTTDPGVTVIGEAADGQQAVAKVRELHPDIVTMDIEMPVMDGLQAIERIMAATAVPILVVTTRADAHTAYAAISKGALDLVVKPDVNLEDAREFIDKLKLLSRINVITHVAGRRAARDGAMAVKKAPRPVPVARTSDRIVAVASSTGGPEALSVILSRLPAELPCPIVVAQHISDGFVTGMVEWLNKLSKLHVKVASDGERVAAGTVYVSPSEKHMQIAGGQRIAFLERHPKDIYRPSCDTLLSSVAAEYGSRSVGVILTGMGSDGVMGMRRIREAGGTTIAQDEETAVIFGMPKVAIESGCIQKILPFTEISDEIVRMTGGRMVAPPGR